MLLRNGIRLPVQSSTHHADTPKRARFFYAVDHLDELGGVPLTKLIKDQDISRTTAYRWLRERKAFGNIMERRHLGRQEKSEDLNTPGSGRPRKIPPYQLFQLLQSDQKSRTLRLSTQLQRAGIQASKRTAQRSLRLLDAGMFRASTQKAITDSQAQLRKDYTSTMRNHPVVGHWDGFQFTDEAHMSLQDFSQAWILRVIGTRTDPENMVMKPLITASVVHFAGWITYHEKAEELIFYNDEYDDYIPPVPPPKPKFRPTTETMDQYNDRVRHWEAEKAREPEVKKPGNSMRASYYTDNILPIYCNAYDSMKARADQLRQHVPGYDCNAFYLIEDNDSSHGTRNPTSLPAVYKLRRGVLTVLHPPNSPDLNPIEAIWNIIKNRVKEYLDSINSIAELKAALQREWKAISQEQIQQRIDEMPGRCHKVFEHPKVRVKSKYW
jgi:hypothetical protein